MALKALLLRKRIDDKKRMLDDLRAKDPDFSKREAELTAAIAEAESEEDKQAVEGMVEEFEKEQDAHNESKATLEGEIAQLERDLEEEEKKQPVPSSAPEPAAPAEKNAETGERKDVNSMSVKMRGFLNMDVHRRDAILARQDVKDFLQRVREMKGQNRAISGSELLIPDVMLELLRENISKYSKLTAYVNAKYIRGNARQPVMGTVPEAIWTEACATLNELSLSFGEIEMDGYKVGGYFSECNATLEDSDLNLASELLDVLGQAIGYAVDKAIVYGTGVKMPVGIVTRLAQTEQPTNWGANAPAWKDLHTSNVVALTADTGKELFQNLIRISARAMSSYARGGLTWIMNETTRKTLVAEAMEFNASAAIVSGVNNSMPVDGGDIVTLDFIPDGDVVFGYLALYLLVQRAGTSMAVSEHVRFIEDRTVFKGTARYDGAPTFGEAFGVLNINGDAPTTSVSFAPDTANP